MSRIIVSRAKQGQSSLILKLEEEVWGEPVTAKWDMSMFIRLGRVFTGTIQDSVVGALVTLQSVQGYVQVMDIVVSRNFQKQQLGRRLYEQLFKELLPEGVGRSVFALVNPGNKASIAFHERLGAAHIGFVHDPYELGEDLDYFNFRFEIEQQLRLI